MNMKEIQKAAAKHGVAVSRMKQVGHFQLSKVTVVNYYPWADCPSAYVQGTTAAIKPCTLEKAIELACRPPERDVRCDPRGKSRKYTKWKDSMYRNRETIACCWCGKDLRRHEATVEHMVPLSKGGGDWAGNWKIACETCNRERGNK